MTRPAYIALERASFQLPDGRHLFSGITERFDTTHTGIVGRNGIGKSVLGRILAGELAPTGGTCTRCGTAHYLAQQITPIPGQTVAGLAGIQPVTDALLRIELGSTAQTDFDTVGVQWDIHARLKQQLAIHHLSHLNADTPVSQLSGGQAMRVAFIGATLSQADILILDEPTNHLDHDSRQALLTQLAQWTGGLIVISHDRGLLDQMTRIVELSSLGLQSYGGNFTFYALEKAREQDTATALLEQRKTERKREERLLREQRERLERRQAKGKKDAANTNQASILVERQKDHSDVSGGKLRMQQDAARETLSANVREAARQIEDTMPIVLFAPDQKQSQAKQFAVLEQLILPYVGEAVAPLNLSITKGQRIGVTGPNGSGKSTLLRILAGINAPVSGLCGRFVKTAYLDQHLALLDPDLSAIAQLMTVNRDSEESILRTRLIQLGITADKVMLPTRMLSGGERLKCALAYTLYADEPAGLLLLDEPANHLDLASVYALETMLNQYKGALVMVSHDERLMQNSGLTHRLETNTPTWSLVPW